MSMNPLNPSVPAASGPADLPPAERGPIYLPADAELRHVLHNEVHARPPARIALPALVVSIAVLHEGVHRDEECEHLRRLPGQQHLGPADLGGSFLRLHYPQHTVNWERHGEFTRYTIVQHLSEAALPPPQGPQDPHSQDWLDLLAVSPEWLRDIPGRTIAAVQLLMLTGDVSHPAAALAQGRRWLGEQPVLASMTGTRGHSLAISDLRLQPSGFERMVVLAAPGTSEGRAGRISQRLLEVETYRMMALRGLPVAKALGPLLSRTETELSEITSQIEQGGHSDKALLQRLAGLAAEVEKATARHAYRFSATEAYHAIVQQRIAELRESPVPGTQTLGVFMNRRLSPAIMTVHATAQRLASLSGRVTRTTALLRTQVDIATEAQNQELLAKLQRGQALQLRLQSTVEGLSIAAISYYVVSLLLYLGKAGKAAGLPIHPELAAGALIPLVVWAVWRTTQRIHQTLHANDAMH